MATDNTGTMCYWMPVSSILLSVLGDKTSTFFHWLKTAKLVRICIWANRKQANMENQFPMKNWEDFSKDTGTWLKEFYGAKFL